jgi:hypothetical protein
MPYRSATVPGHGELHRSRTHRDLVLRARQRVTAPTDRAARRERAILGTMVADPGAAPGLQAYETCVALCVPALAPGEGLEPSMSRVTTGCLTFWLSEIVCGNGWSRTIFFWASTRRYEPFQLRSQMRSRALPLTRKTARCPDRGGVRDRPNGTARRSAPRESLAQECS